MQALIQVLYRFALWVGVGFIPVHAWSQTVDIEFGFNNKPPLFYFENGQATGSVVQVVRQACQTAKLVCTYSELPFLRVMDYLERKRAGFAALGFSRTPER